MLSIAIVEIDCNFDHIRFILMCVGSDKDLETNECYDKGIEAENYADE